MSDDLIRVIQDVHAGQYLRSGTIEAHLAKRAAPRQLTPREIEVIDLVVQAMRNKEIAAALGVSA